MGGGGGGCVPASAGPVFFLFCFWFAGILVIVGVSSHLRLIMRSYKACSADEEGHNVTTLAGLAACSFPLLFILFAYSSDLEFTVHCHAHFITDLH